MGKKINIPGIGIPIEEEDDEIRYVRVPEKNTTLKINTKTEEILNRDLDNDHKTKVKQISQTREKSQNLNQSHVGVKYEQTFDVGGYKVAHTHYNDDSQVYKVYKNGRYIGTAYSTSDLHDLIDEDKNKGDD